MHMIIMLLLALVTKPRELRAVDSCSQCVLGIWDDPALSRNVGEIVAGQPKDVYVGIKFAGGFSGTSGISFSIAGMDAFLVAGVETIVPTASACDYLGAPADTSIDSHAVGGCNFYWPVCLVGDQALLRVTLITFDPVVNALLQVKRRYPAWPPDTTAPAFDQCDGPLYTRTRVKGGYYILNWNGDPSVRVDGASWSTVKTLFR